MKGRRPSGRESNVSVLTLANPASVSLGMPHSGQRSSVVR